MLFLKPMSNKKTDQLILYTGPVSWVTYDLSGQFTHPQKLARNTFKTIPNSKIISVSDIVADVVMSSTLYVNM
jgi:hypothetical protein